MTWKKGWVESRKTPGSTVLVDYRVLSAVEMDLLKKEQQYSHTATSRSDIARVMAHLMRTTPEDLVTGHLLFCSQEPLHPGLHIEAKTQVVDFKCLVYFLAETHSVGFEAEMKEMVFSTGMRISELVNIKKVQIDKTGRVFIRGKGKKERFVYLTPRAFKWIQKYIQEARGDDPSPYLFIPSKGKSINKKDKKISPNYLQERIKHYRELLGFNIPTSCHSIRHAFATYLAENGANPAAIQILLGHESLDTTTRYVHASDRYAEKSHHDFHPLKE